MRASDGGNSITDSPRLRLVVVAGADTVCRADGYEALRRIPDHRWVVYEGLPHKHHERGAGALRDRPAPLPGRRVDVTSGGESRGRRRPRAGAAA